MNPLFIIIEFFWLTIWIMLCLQFVEALREVDFIQRILAMTLLLVGAPFFLITNVLEGLLSLILPEDWNSEDE